METPKRFYWYNNKFFFTYKTKYTAWINKRIQNKPWHCWDEWAISIGKGDRWFGIDHWYYDGHIYDSITLFRIEIAKMYMYQSEELK